MRPWRPDTGAPVEVGLPLPTKNASQECVDASQATGRGAPVGRDMSSACCPEGTRLRLHPMSTCASVCILAVAICGRGALQSRRSDQLRSFALSAMPQLALNKWGGYQLVRAHAWVRLQAGPAGPRPSRIISTETDHPGSAPYPRARPPPQAAGGWPQSHEHTHIRARTYAINLRLNHATFSMNNVLGRVSMAFCAHATC